MATGSSDGESFRLSSASVPLGGLTFLSGIALAIVYVLGLFGVIGPFDPLMIFLAMVSIACGYQAVFVIPHLIEQLRILHNTHAVRLADLERRMQSDRVAGRQQDAEPGAAADGGGM